MIVGTFVFYLLSVVWPFILTVPTLLAWLVPLLMWQSLGKRAIQQTLFLLLIGFIGLDLAHFGYPSLTRAAAYVLILCALNAWYMMAHVIFLQVFGKDILPVGKPWISGEAEKVKGVPVAAKAKS